jgi:AcrR family transcriptional regulator
MAGMSDHVKRPYRSVARAAAAAPPRGRGREAAAELFAREGYAATTLRQIAQRAGVGERTLYDHYGNKAQLLRYTINVLTVGDETRVLSIDRPQAVQARESDDPRQALTLHLDWGVGVMERAGDLIMVAYQVSGSEPDLGDTVIRGITSAHGIHLELTKRLAERKQLRAGLDAQQAADILYALAGPATHQALRRHRGWSVEEYRSWLVQTAIQQLLPDDPANTPLQA